MSISRLASVAAARFAHRVDHLARRGTARPFPEVVVLAIAAAATAVLLEVALGAYGHGTHLLLFLAAAIAGGVFLGPRGGMVMLLAGAAAAAGASIAGLGSAEPMSELVTQLVLYLGTGGSLLVVLRLAVEGRRRVAPPPPIEFDSARLDALTARELDTLRLAATGLSVHEIGELLFVSPNTVKSHISHAYDKLGARNRAQAVRAALHCGCITPGDILATGDPTRPDPTTRDPAAVEREIHPKG